MLFMANFSKQQSTENKCQMIADTNYTSARIWSGCGRQQLEIGLKEMRANNLPLAITSMKEALLHFDKATKAYERAHEYAPSQKMMDRYERKARKLQSCDIACAMNALRRMEPKAESPTDSDGITTRSRII